MWFTYTVEYYCALKKAIFESFVEKCMHLKAIILSEINQKLKYCMTPLIRESQSRNNSKKKQKIQKKKKDVLQMQRGTNDVGEEEEVKKIKMCYIHAPIFHNEYNQYTQRTNTNKHKKAKL